MNDNRSYYIPPNGISFLANALENPNLVQISLAKDVYISVYVNGLIEYGFDGNYRKWYLSAYNTKFNTNNALYIYARLSREYGTGMIWFSQDKYNPDGTITDKEDSTASEEYYYIHIGEITATNASVTLDREITYDSGILTSDKVQNDHSDINEMFELDKVSTPWLIKAKYFLYNFTVKGIITLIGGLAFSKGKDGDQKVVTDLKRSTDSDEDTPVTDAVIPTARYVKEDTEKKFLRKNKEDTASGLIHFLKGITVKVSAKFGEFITGVSGGFIGEDGDLEMESGVFRKRLFVPEIAYNRTTYFKGRMVNSPGGGCTVKEWKDNGDGTYTVTPDLTDADGLSQFVDDILTTYFVTKNASGKLNGFEEMKFRVTAADYTKKIFILAPRPGHDWKPADQMILAQTGNFTDPERQTYILIDSVNGNNCITFFDHANTWDVEPAQMPAWFGKKKGMTVAGIDCDNYSAVLQNILMTGLIFQIDEITGDKVRVPLDKGKWVSGQRYAYYDRVSHNGSLWLCVNDKGTTTEPSDTHTDWLKQVAEGKQGEPGLSVVGGGHWESVNRPYKANTIVSFANSVFLSKVDTSNPPIAIARFNNGNFRRMKNGGYILAGKSQDWQVNEDWEMLMDGRELKGTSITFLGRFATAPANPVEGNSYYNTVDHATYIYQQGAWMLMVSDGKDGKSYEYIYKRTNTMLAPDRPDSKQQDDYVPEGWTDDFLGVDADHQLEWGCTRTKTDGVWSEFSNPAIVHRWSKDGENAIMADLDNEMENSALTSDGKVMAAQTWNTTVSMWYGTEKLTLDSITCTPDANLVCSTNKDAGLVTVSVSAGVFLASTNNVKITVRATKNGQQYSRDLVFTVAGVRGGADAILYSIVPSVTSVSKDKNGNYSVSSVSCYRQRSVGGVITTTTDGTLKYSIDGGAETTINNNTAISSGSFSRTLKFIFYVNNQIVDIETIPMLADGKDGSGITAAGHWISANTPYPKNSTVYFAGGSYLSKVDTSNPPIAISRFKNGSYRRKRDGGYILAGKSSDRQVNPDWQEMVAPVDPSASYWIDTPVNTINFTSTGTPSPSAFVATMKQNVNGRVSDTNKFYLVARKYNGSWAAHVGATLSNQISVPATAGYTQFAVRAYSSSSDANAWNDNFVAEKGVGVATDGKQGVTGATGAMPRDMGVFESGKAYVWNADYRDKIIYLFNGVYYNFLVRNYGASVTAAPTSFNGDSNWEDMQKFVNIATNTLFADGANVAGFMFKNKVLKSYNDEGETLLINGETGYFKCNLAEISGTIVAKKGSIAGFNIDADILSNTYNSNSSTLGDVTTNVSLSSIYGLKGTLKRNGSIYTASYQMGLYNMAGGYGYLADIKTDDRAGGMSIVGMQEGSSAHALIVTGQTRIRNSATSGSGVLLGGLTLETLYTSANTTVNPLGCEYSALVYYGSADKTVYLPNWNSTQVKILIVRKEGSGNLILRPSNTWTLYNSAANRIEALTISDTNRTRLLTCCNKVWHEGYLA